MPSKVQLFGPTDKNTTIWSPGSEQNPDGCANVYQSLFVEGYFYKACPTGFSSNQLYLSLPAGFVSSTISQEDATQAARELLAARGAELAEAQGVCSLGEFQEVFSTVDSAINWDWVADKATTFPREFKNTIPDGFGKGTGDDSGTIVEFPIGNSLCWPLMIGFFYSDTTLFLDEAPNQIAPSEALRVDIHSTYGLIHMDFRSMHHSLYPSLNVYAGRNVSEGFPGTDVEDYTSYSTCLYAGKLVADFGSREIYGPVWNADTDGKKNLEDNPFKAFEPNPDYMPEFTVASLGGFLFRIDTASRSVINGKLAGVYLVCYKEDIQVYKYDAMADDYVSVGTIPFNPKNTTTYYAASILFNGTNKFLEIYLDGQFELSIADDTLTNIHLPVCYQRGVFSMDHWVGDIVSGVTYPGTNRLPPPITTRYFEPTDIQLPTVVSPYTPSPVHYVLLAPEIVGGETALEVNKPFPELAAGPVGSGFNHELLDYTTQIDSNWGGAFFGAACNVLTHFDLSVYPELGKVLWGSLAVQVGKIEFNRYSEVPNIPSNPYKFLPTAYQIIPLVPTIDLPGIDWVDYDLFRLFIEGFDQHPRWSCSWDSIFQPSELFSSSGTSEESGNATALSELNDRELPVFQAGLYEATPIQTGDGWLYSTSLINLAPGRMFTNVSQGVYTDILSKADIIDHYYFFSAGWFDIQVFRDIFTSIRTIKFMTGVQGKRTSEVLEAPEYNFNYSCPVAPTLDPIDLNIKCINQEYVLTGAFTGIDGTGTFFQFANDTKKDCLFGDPYDNVCYPSRQTWSEGFNMNPVLAVVFNAGQGLEVFFNANPTELVYQDARILLKIFTEFPVLTVNVFKEGWPGTLFTTQLFLELRSEINDPPAEDIAYSTLQEACYFVPGLAVATYRENVLESAFIDLVELGPEYKFVFTLP